MTQVRSATSTDIDALLTLNAYVQTWHADTYPNRFKHNPDPVHLRGMFEEKIAATDSYLWIATQDNTPAGYLFATHVIRPETPISHAASRLHIEHIVTAPDARRAGVATQLIATAEATARMLNTDELTLDTWAANSIAHATFRAAGLEPVRLWFAKPL